MGTSEFVANRVPGERPTNRRVWTNAARLGSRSLQVALARTPGLYSRLLRIVKRGSDEKRLFLRLIRPGDVVLDVGANEGYFTLLFSDLVGTAGAVHAFEPVEPTFARLRARLLHDGWFRNAHLVQAACGDVGGVATLLVPGTDRGQAALVRHHAGSWASAREVSRYEAPLLTLDGYLAVLNCPRVDFVKLDVEGAELRALRGMQSTLAAHRPLLSLEAYAEWMRGFGETPRALTRFLRAAGYDLLFVLRDRMRRVTEDEVSALAEVGPINLLCGSSGAHLDRLARCASLADFRAAGALSD
jgi:FkbM family methyltransferase